MFYVKSKKLLDVREGSLLTLELKRAYYVPVRDPRVSDLITWYFVTGHMRAVTNKNFLNQLAKGRLGTTVAAIRIRTAHQEAWAWLTLIHSGTTSF
ncbi:MAG: hypothetical protein ACO2O2_08735 [Acidilobaceae archaeon]